MNFAYRNNRLFQGEISIERPFVVVGSGHADESSGRKNIASSSYILIVQIKVSEANKLRAASRRDILIVSKQASLAVENKQKFHNRRTNKKRISNWCHKSFSRSLGIIIDHLQLSAEKRNINNYHFSRSSVQIRSYLFNIRLYSISGYFRQCPVVRDSSRSNSFDNNSFIQFKIQDKSSTS